MSALQPSLASVPSGPADLLWSRRSSPLPPAAVVASPRVAPALAAAAARRIVAGARLRAAGDGDWLVVLGEAADLPWADRVTYVGWDGGLLVPTTMTPTPPPDLLHPALRHRSPPGCDLIVAFPDRILISPIPVRPADPAVLAAFAARASR